MRHKTQKSSLDPDSGRVGPLSYFLMLNADMHKNSESQCGITSLIPDIEIMSPH